MTAEEIIRALRMQPHPEGGYFVETFRDVDGKAGERALSTAIYYLLEKNDCSHWHRVDASEVWHYYAGAALTLSLSTDGSARRDLTLGPDLAGGERPQIVVLKDHWQAARSTGDWTLVGCTVAPGFEFSGFEIAEKGWEPGKG